MFFEKVVSHYVQVRDVKKAKEYIKIFKALVDRGFNYLKYTGDNKLRLSMNDGKVNVGLYIPHQIEPCEEYFDKNIIAKLKAIVDVKERDADDKWVRINGTLTVGDGKLMKVEEPLPTDDFMNAKSVTLPIGDRIYDFPKLPKVVDKDNEYVFGYSGKLWYGRYVESTTEKVEDGYHESPIDPTIRTIRHKEVIIPERWELMVIGECPVEGMVARSLVNRAKPSRVMYADANFQCVDKSGAIISYVSFRHKQIDSVKSYCDEFIQNNPDEKVEEIW